MKPSAMQLGATMRQAPFMFLSDWKKIHAASFGGAAVVSDLAEVYE